MVIEHFPSPSRNRIVLFGGQGSRTIFSSAASSNARRDARSSTTGATLLSRCHAAFLEDFRSLGQHPKDTLGIDISRFHRPEDLLDHQNPFRCHGLIEATTICIYQLLHYLAELERSGEDFSSWTQKIIETTGFCSGLLSATVVASSSTVAEFIDCGVEAFRLAFWIGYWTSFESQDTCAAHNKEASWSLVVLGLSLPQVEEILERFHRETNLRTLRVSAISSAKVISLTGPGSDLNRFREQLGSEAVTKFAHIHAWYHGGEQLENAANLVLQSISKQKIRFPGIADLERPIRSPHDGHLLNTQTSHTTSLTEWVIRHMLIYSVDWVKVSRGISATTEMSLEGSTSAEVEIISLGPSTESILAEIKSLVTHPKLKYIDRSPFRSSENSNASVNGQEDIAIVGMGVNFPKGKDKDELWKTLSDGLNAILEIPNSRFDVSQYYAADESHKARTMPVRDGAFIDDLWEFDNSFFNISPREAKSMDPQQRVILSTTQVALEDAGYVGDATASFQKSSIGCYIGIATGDYADNLKNDIDVFYSPGTLRAFHSGRISYIYKLSGPSMTIDTACSSSLVSVYQACRALQSGDCTAAIAGGANAITSPEMYLGLSRGHFLSRENGCKPFDEAADGYGRAEGCGIFVLKRLEDAVAENDRIHGVIKGVQANQSGNAHSITHPHSETQKKLFERLLKKSSTDPASVSVIEAHGTGTQAGDSREINSLRAVFEKAHSMANPLIVSSIKGNIGHCEAASGAAGLAKLLLMLHNKKIPMQANLSKLNPELGDLENGGIIIPRRLLPWESQQSQPRRAMLNNFGAAGSNVALLLEERIDPTSVKPKVEDRSNYVFNLSAKSKETLNVSIQAHQQFLIEAPPQLRLKDICYSATARRQAYDHRVSISCSSISDLQAKLANIDLGDTRVSKDNSPTVFIFSGQGSLYYGMGTELIKSSSLFKDSILRCDNTVQSLGFPSILGFLCEERSSYTQLDQSDEIIASQCACVALEYSMSKLLMSWNIIPEYVAGHSLGEYAALAVSGAITIEDSLYIVAHRAQMMVDECVANASGMVACKLSPYKADAILAKHKEFSNISVACRNSGSDCVIAGPLQQLQVFQETCSKEGIKTKKLDVPYGFHSSSMDPIVEPLKKLCKSIKCSKNSIPVASNVLGRLFTQEDFQSDYFALHAREPVRFSDTIEQLRIQGVFDSAVCLEIGPHPTTLPMIRNALDTSCHCFPTLQRDKDAWTTLGALLGHFFRTGQDINWRRVFEMDVKLIDLPRYPLTNPTFLVRYDENSQGLPGSKVDPSTYVETGFDLLPRLLTPQPSSSKEDSMQFETTMANLGSLISGHNVGGTAICPASVFHELALEAAHVAMPPSEDKLLVVREMSFTHPLIYYPKEDSKIVRVNLVRIKKDESGLTDELNVMVNVVPNDGESLCCTAIVSKKTSSEIKRSLHRDTAMVDRQSHYLLNEHVPYNTFHKKLLYETIFTRVVNYSAEYQSLTKLSLADSNYEAIGSFVLPENSRVHDFITPPVFTDTLLHAAGFAANLGVSSDEICICSDVESVEILDTINYSDTFTIYCTLVDMNNGILLADAYALNPNRRATAVVRGMEFKKLRLSSFKRMLQHASRITTTEKIPPESPPELSFSTSDTPGTPNSHQSGTTTPEITIKESHESVHDTMNSMIGQIYGSSDLDSNKPLDALGIDSLMQIEMAAKLQEAFPGKCIDQNDILNCETLQALEDFLVLKSRPEERTAITQRSNERATKDDISILLEGFQETSQDGSQANPIHLHVSDSAQLPLYLIHDGSGHVNAYSRICDIDRDVFGFFDPEFPRQDSTIATLEQMAEQYSSRLSMSQTPSLIIGGWSFGGVVAFRAAQVLSKAGHQIKGLVLIDSPCPRRHEPLPENVIAHVLHLPANNHRSDVATEFKQNAALLAGYEPMDFDDNQHAKIKTVYLRSQETFDTRAASGVRYDWLSNQQARDASICGWETLVGDHIEVLPVPGNHFQPFIPENIAQTSAQLKKACRYIETAK